MKSFRSLSFRYKLFFTNLALVLVVVIGITAMTTLTASRHAIRSNMDSLNMITEQALNNLAATTRSTAQGLFSSFAGSGMLEEIKNMRRYAMDSHDYFIHRQYFINALGRVAVANDLFDRVAVLLDQLELIVLQDATAGAENRRTQQEAEALFSIPRNAENTYGACVWTRLPNGSLWLVRDVYTQSPLKHVGKAAVRIRQEALVGLRQENQNFQCSILFFQEDGALTTMAGLPLDDETISAAALLREDSRDVITVGGGRYAVSVRAQGGWRAVGLLPERVVNGVSSSLLNSALIVALGGILFGVIAAVAVSSRMSRQVHALTLSMNRVAAGDLNQHLPVESGDDIGMLTGHFNSMTERIRGLLEKVVQEEKNKREAEYRNLEYEYRFLQWQINPHFIYNALETVNGLAKLDGNPELSDIIARLSDYFRQNAESIRRKFVTVRQEFRSLRQYAEIYQCVYGDALEVTFTISPGAEQAYLPTMIMQPIMENALVHGTGNAAGTHICAEACLEGEELVVRVRDNGSGMEQAVIDRLLRQETPDENDKTSLGVRNVLERMELIYGGAASLRFDSTPGEGTCVTIRFPLHYEERKTLYQQDTERSGRTE